MPVEQQIPLWPESLLWTCCIAHCAQEQPHHQLCAVHMSQSCCPVTRWAVKARRVGVACQAMSGICLAPIYVFSVHASYGHGLVLQVLSLLVGGGMALSGKITAEQLTTFVLYVEFVTAASLSVCDQWGEQSILPFTQGFSRKTPPYVL